MKISDKIERIDDTMANSYVIRKNDHVILVDAGTKGTGKKIIKYFQEKNEKPDTVLITHYHMDHIGGLKLIVDQFSPRVFAPPEEVNAVKGIEKQAPAKSFLSKMVSTVAKTDPVQNVESTEQLDIAGIKVVETHGHTPGSTSYYLEEEGALFVGDAVSNNSGNLVINKGFTRDIEEAEKSREKILGFKGSTVLPGHGDPLKI